MKKAIILFLLCFCHTLIATFDYDLKLTSLPGKNDRTLVCFHGYGGSHAIAFTVQKYTDSTVVSFNFPEYDIHNRVDELTRITFGSIDELLPALYVLQKTVLEQGLSQVDLYGFSAGGGVVINMLSVLNTDVYDAYLQQIGIGKEEKAKLLAAIQNGIILLDVPLKSVDEIIAFRGSTKELEHFAARYKENDFRPIDSLKKLTGLNLEILLYFDQHDQVLSNRDDQLYIARLRQSQPEGMVTVIQEDQGGHKGPHLSLWQSYAERIYSY